MARTRWQILRSTYNRKGLVLVLGAGVSVASGVPSWDALLEELAGNIDSGKVLKALRARGFSPAASAAALEDLYPSRQHFVSAIRTALYRRTPLEHDAAPPRKLDQLRRNETLRALAAFCARAGNDGYQRNPRVHAVVSFNLDTLLEVFAEARYERPILRPIKDASWSSAPSLTSVYHIHGFVPVTGAAPKDVVLTEAAYFDTFGEPFSNFTYTFLYLLHEYSCLFVGLSMRDDNLRRLLYYSVRERLASIRSDRRDEAVQRHFAIMRRESPAIDAVVEKGLARLGVRTLWIRDHAAIAKNLAAVYESTGGHWKDVF